MLKKGSSGDAFEFKFDCREETLALEGHGAGKSSFGQVCEQLSDIVSIWRHKEAPWSVGVENEEDIDSEDSDARHSRTSARK
jgi:hypothetical protein